jgi:hypothetical protein
MYFSCCDAELKMKMAHGRTIAQAVSRWLGRAITQAVSR